MITYRDFKAAIRRTLWPHPGEARSLVAAHDGFFLEAMIDLGWYVRDLQVNHTDVHPACSTYLECGKTLFEAPKGLIKRVYTVANGDYCGKVYYDPSDYSKIECWSRNLLSTYRAPANRGLPALQQGLKYAEASTDSVVGRSRVGLYGLHRKRLYLVPWVQSNESIVVEWDGNKRDWRDEDLLDENEWDAQVAGAVEDYVFWMHLKRYEPGASAQDKREAERAYQDSRAELIYQCEERLKERAPDACNVNPLPTAAQLAAEAIPVAVPSVFAILGDYGIDNADEGLVAALVAGWQPEYIVSLGGNWFGADVVLDDLDLKVGQYFADYIFPYRGNFSSAADEQKFYPAIGEVDRDPDGRLALEQVYFNMPGRYYDFVKGPVHYFMYDTGYDRSGVNQEGDGIGLGSTQAAWLQTKLALSTARFKVVILHHPPFSSAEGAATAPLAGDGTISYPALRLPFAAWGANVVISAHANVYERLLGDDGLVYIVCGLGGAEAPDDFRDPVLSTSVKRYNGAFGAIQAEADCDLLQFRFFNVSGEQIDAFGLRRRIAPAGGGGSGNLLGEGTDVLGEDEMLLGETV